ncbi:hypothetical protein CAOG_04369 [Capsaspora owczarzaki ATCC 30864]|uniref:ENTH domain-containing protein n=1 Tax=Capsaspora owczarzaki (strain ATCC 30864) TaxID=595528 RepID=A0A0D2VRT5_CAPO3|nr:hypothetical protein CAOG_04369 [Capsaspora owczarzaki ATCC 30864]KJE93607.1 hypothetical protein CAOG_004369 [Capsaspora owczarzaki ATCC 30864]|eukprot:XP_004348197.1 hypothetical protein CAOG_04369 [Capsaspora owczarzaki ATCC 30864]
MRKGTTVMGTLTDRVDVVKHSLGSDTIAVAVVKATNNDICAPKRKHVENILNHLSFSGGISPNELVRLLHERLQTKNWVSVFKTLIVYHILMRDGQERFSRYLGEARLNLNVLNFLDKSNPQAYDMSGFIRRYARYLETRVATFSQLDLDPIRRAPSAEKHIKTLPVAALFSEAHSFQVLVDSLLEMQAREDEMNNYVISAAFVYLMKDLIRLYAVLNDYVIRILEIFFDLDKTGAKEALEIYKKYLHETGIMMKFMELARISQIISDDEVPDLAQAPTALLKALEEHVRNFDIRSTPAPSASSSVAADIVLPLNGRPRAPSDAAAPSASNGSTGNSGGFASFHQKTAPGPARPPPPAAAAATSAAAPRTAPAPGPSASPAGRADLLGGDKQQSLNKQIDLLSLDDFDPISSKGGAQPVSMPASRPSAPAVYGQQPSGFGQVAPAARGSVPTAYAQPAYNASQFVPAQSFSPSTSYQQQPFGQPYAQQPFGQQPFGAQQQPFAAQPFAAQQQPYGQPFGAPQQQQPFGQSFSPVPQQQQAFGAPQSTNPFGAPFAPQQANPFGQPQQQQPQQQQQRSNFASDPFANPFA